MNDIDTSEKSVSILRRRRSVLCKVLSFLTNFLLENGKLAKVLKERKKFWNAE